MDFHKISHNIQNTQELKKEGALLCLEVENLRLQAIIGILDFERIIPQTLLIDAKIFYYYNGEFLDYARIVEFIKNDLVSQKYGLVEELLLSLSAKLKAEFSEIHKLHLCAKKPDILESCIVGASLWKEFC